MFDRLMVRARRALDNGIPDDSYAAKVSTASSADAALVALLRHLPTGWSWPEVTERVLETGDPLAVWRSVHEDGLIPDPSADAELDQAAAELTRWQRSGHRFVSILDEAYPRQLRDIREAPPFLFAAGSLRTDDRAVSVVGSRKASEGGLRMTAEIARGLVDRGITVVSGLALGIDGAAHEAALEAGGRTVAVIGTGITGYYPRNHRALQDRIAREGLLLSQFWPDAPPTKHTFPMRNAVMSGYGVASVIVEAGEHSGARIQARVAVEHGRPVILTDRVVRANEWARRMTSQPGVSVVASVTGVFDALGRLQDERMQVGRILAQLTASM